MMKNKFYLFLVVFILIAAVCLLAYSSSFGNPFLWDDEGLIVINQFIKELSSWGRVFTSDLYSSSLAGSNFYRPVQTLSFILDYHLWHLNPFGYHLTNVLLQIIVAFLIFLLILTLLNDSVLAFVAALLFAVSPIHCEAVTYISGRADMLMAVFLISSLLAFIRTFEIKSLSKYIWLAVALFLFVLGLLSKELAGIFPFVILAWVYYFKKEELKKRFFFIRFVFPFFVLFAIYLLLRLTALKFATMYEPQLAKYPLLVRIEAFPLVLWTYLKIMVFPVGLHMSRTLILPEQLIGKALLFAGFLGVWTIVLYTCFSKKINKISAFLTFWFFIFLLPQSGIFPINAFVSDHFVYLSSISFFVLVAYLLKRYLGRKAFVFVASVLILFFGVLTFGRNFEWRNQEAFFSRIIKFSPSSYLAHNNLGIQFENNGEFKRAVSEYKKAVEIKPRMVMAVSNLANVYYKMKMFAQAQEQYSLLERMVPADKAGELQNNIGALYDAQGLHDQAVSRFKLALILNPRLDLVHFNLARVYLKMGKPALAEEEIISSFKKSNLDELSAGALGIIRSYLAQAKDLNCAVTFYNDLGVKFAEAKEFVLAQYCFSHVVTIAPNYADVYFNLGILYLKQSRPKEAFFEFKRVLEMNPNHDKARQLVNSLSKSL
ncbi:MAG: tetratricopeptide repeat protein [Candidatus Omnitrophica bacterium]|nr:tetratricopeptide repeat protein [Candidatus Omnitrophota bacterium]